MEMLLICPSLLIVSHNTDFTAQAVYQATTIAAGRGWTTSIHPSGCTMTRTGITKDSPTLYVAVTANAEGARQNPAIGFQTRTARVKIR